MLYVFTLNVNLILLLVNDLFGRKFRPIIYHKNTLVILSTIERGSAKIASVALKDLIGCQ